MTTKGDLLRVDPEFKIFVNEIQDDIALKLGLDEKGKRKRAISSRLVTQILAKKWKKNKGGDAFIL